MGGGGAFVAGAIVAKMLLDKSGFDASSKAVKKEGDEMGSKMAGLTTGLTKAGKAMSVAGAAITGSIVAMAMAASDTAEQFNLMSAKTGMAVEDLSRYKYVAEVADSSLEAISGGLRRLMMDYDDLQKGSGKASEGFAKLGVSVKDAAGTIKPMNDLLLEVADKFVGMEDGPAKSAAAMEMFGKQGLAMLPFLNLGSQGIKELGDEAERFGLVMSTEAARAADDFGDKMTSLKLGLKGVSQQLALAIIPTLTAVVIKIKEVVMKITEWIKAHPGLADAIMKFALGLGAVLAVGGPLLIIIAKLITSFGVMKTALAAVNWAKFGTAAAVAGAALVGWKIGEWIGKVTGLNKVIEEGAAKLFAWLGVAKEVGRLNDENHTSMEALRMEALARATELAGKAIGSIGDAQKILVAQYKEHGTTGSAVLDTMAKKWSENIAAVDLAAAAHKNLKPAIVDAEAAAKALAEATEKEKAAFEEFIGFINTGGIQILQQQETEIEKLWNWQDRMEKLWKSGQITLAQYNQGLGLITTELAKYGRVIETALPPSRNFFGLIEKAPMVLEDMTYGVETLDHVLDLWADQMGVSAASTRILMYDIVALQLKMAGFGNLPVFDALPGKIGETTAAVAEQSHEWDGLFNSVTQKLGEMLQSFVQGEMSITTIWNRLWKNVRETFFTTIAQMASKFLVDLVKNAILGGAKTAVAAVETIGKSVSGVGSAVSSAASGIGGTLASLGTGVASIITSLAGAIGTGIGAIAAGIGAAVVALATAIASAATILAAAAPALLIVGAIAIAIYAGFSAIGALLAGGGGGAGDGMGRVVERQDIFLAGWGWWHVDMINIMVYMQGRLDYIVDKLEMIGERIGGGGGNEQTDVLWKIYDAVQHGVSHLEDLTHAQHGAIIREPSLVMMGEEGPRNPEIAMPMDDYRSALAAAGSAGRSVNMMATFNINGAIDDNGVRKLVRTKIGPEFVSWIKANLGKESMQAALGV